MVRQLFDQERKVMLTEYSGTLTLAVLAQGDALAARFMARRGEVVPASSIFPGSTGSTSHRSR